MYSLYKEDVEDLNKIEQDNLDLTSINDDQQQQWPTTFERLFHSYQRYNELRRKDDAIE